MFDAFDRFKPYVNKRLANHGILLDKLEEKKEKRKEALRTETNINFSYRELVKARDAVQNSYSRLNSLLKRFSESEYYTAEHEAKAKSIAMSIVKKEYLPDFVFSDFSDSSLVVVFFDVAYTMGVNRAVRLLQRALKVKEDGIFGVRSRTELFKSKLSQKDLAELLLKEQYDRFNYLAMREKYALNKNGWTNRVKATGKEQLGLDVQNLIDKGYWKDYN